MKKTLVVAIALSLVLVMGLDAQVQRVSPQTKIKLPAGKLQLKLRTDLRVDIIHASRCKCDFSDVNAFYMSNIMVDVSNHKVGGAGVATESVLTVKYFDLLQGRMVSVSKNLPKMNPYPANPWVMQQVVMVNHPVLAKADVGITAEIAPKSNTVGDADPSNNKKVIHKCQVMVY